MVHHQGSCWSEETGGYPTLFCFVLLVGILK
nr:MAG TPA: hypothetical protein [Caudoviricetes sp.]